MARPLIRQTLTFAAWFHGGEYQRSICAYSTVPVRKFAVGDQLTKLEIDQILRSNERHVALQKGAIAWYETNQLAANSPCEDHYAEAVSALNGSHFFGVFDGHAGYGCSQTVAKRLFDYMALAMQKGQLSSLPDKIVQWLHCSSAQPVPESHRNNLNNFFAYCQREKESLANVKLAFQAAFLTLDQDLSADAQPSSSGDPLDETAIAAAFSGSCACVASVRASNLHVASVGDSSAILGVCNEQGQWSVRSLTKEHSFHNVDEMERIKSEHPIREAGSVLKGGRLLGLLMPLRAFGDVRFKWPAELQRSILEAQYKVPVVPPNLETPPYLTARPEVYYHRLTANDKFMVIASDGLWECITPEKVVRLISDHMIGRETLSPYLRSPDATVEKILQDLTIRQLGEDKQPLDENSATHLIRHALSGSGSEHAAKQYKSLNTMLTLPGGLARKYRDDMTVIVIYFDTEFAANESKF